MSSENTVRVLAGDEDTREEENGQDGIGRDGLYGTPHDAAPLLKPCGQPGSGERTQAEPEHRSPVHDRFFNARESHEMFVEIHLERAAERDTCPDDDREHEDVACQAIGEDLAHVFGERRWCSPRWNRSGCP